MRAHYSRQSQRGRPLSFLREPFPCRTKRGPSHTPTTVLGANPDEQPGMLPPRPHPTSCGGGSGPSPLSLTSLYGDQRGGERSRSLRMESQSSPAAGKLIYHRCPSSAAASSGQKRSEQTQPPGPPRKPTWKTKGGKVSTTVPQSPTVPGSWPRERESKRKTQD